MCKELGIEKASLNYIVYKCPNKPALQSCAIFNARLSPPLINNPLFSANDNVENNFESRM